MNNTSPRRKGMRVDFINRKEDRRCVVLASMGFSTAYICECTQLSPCQVTYRLSKAGLTRANGTSRSDFRNGTSPFARVVLSSAQYLADVEVMKYLKNNYTT